MHETSEARLLDEASAGFAARFGAAPEAVAWAPGRVNLLGEHTDYNGGYVLPMPLALGTAVAIGRAGVPGTFTLASGDFDGVTMRTMDEAATGHWSDYLLGTLVAGGAGAETGLRALAVSDLPVGSGLSSSAAIEIATLRALAALTGVTLDPVEAAQTARGVENGFIGMPCGIMDQFTVSVGTPGSALFLDTRTLAHEPAPLPPGHSFIVIHSGVSHKLATSGYATRVAECKAACDALGVAQLSDLGAEDLPRIAALDAPLDRRARHIVTDNRLTREGLAALAAGDAARFGRLMVDSHASERDDYQITVPETDAMVETALAAGALGARQTGGGWGGSIVALAADDHVEVVSAAVTGAFPATRVLAIT